MGKRTEKYAVVGLKVPESELARWRKAAGTRSVQMWLRSLASEGSLPRRRAREAPLPASEKTLTESEHREESVKEELVEMGPVTGEQEFVREAEYKASVPEFEEVPMVIEEIEGPEVEGSPGNANEGDSLERLQEEFEKREEVPLASEEKKPVGEGGRVFRRDPKCITSKCLRLSAACCAPCRQFNSV